MYVHNQRLVFFARQHLTAFLAGGGRHFVACELNQASMVRLEAYEMSSLFPLVRAIQFGLRRRPALSSLKQPVANSPQSPNYRRADPESSSGLMNHVLCKDRHGPLQKLVAVLVL